MTLDDLDANNAEDESASATALGLRILRCLRRQNGQAMSADDLARELKAARGKIVPVLRGLYNDRVLEAEEVKGGRMMYWVRRPQDQACLLQLHWKGWKLR